MTDDTIDEDALSRVLGIAKKTIRNLRCTAPWRLPPECTPRGQRHKIWRQRDVDQWLRDQVRPAALPPRRPGRPKKAEAKAARHG